MKSWVKRRAPFLGPASRRLRRGSRRTRRRVLRLPQDLRRLVRRTLARGLPGESVERRFERIYRMNLWRGEESRSGPGSSLEETAVIRAELPRLVRELDARVLLDIPCGDFFWMRQVLTELDLETYIGADVVANVIEENNRRYGSPRCTFVRLDLCSDLLPRADLVVVRDVLDHLSFADIRLALSNLVASGSTYLLATTYPVRPDNTDIRSGDWRPLNLEAAPLSLPAPLELINEQSAKPGYPDKSLGLWRISDLQ